MREKQEHKKQTLLSKMINTFHIFKFALYGDTTNEEVTPDLLTWCEEDWDGTHKMGD